MNITSGAAKGKSGKFAGLRHERGDGLSTRKANKISAKPDIVCVARQAFECNTGEKR